MRVELGKFASWGIQARFGADLEAFVQAALLHYTRRLKSKTPPAEIPQMFLERDGPDETVALEVVVAPDIWAALEREAHAQRVPVETVLAHAVFVYLADLDSAVVEELDMGPVPPRTPPG
jgi:hypothetical protein